MVFHFKGSQVWVSRSRIAGRPRITVPSSKSLTNRYLLLGGLSRGVCTLQRPLECIDTNVMRKALTCMGCQIEDIGESWEVRSPKVWNAREQEPLFIENAGTAMRFLLAACSMLDTPVVLDGNERMRVRPLTDLVHALEQLHVKVRYLGRKGCPPIEVGGPIQPGEVSLKADVSSQYLSALLMTLPLCDGNSQIRLNGPLVSRTYVKMTLECLRQCGVEIEADTFLRVFDIPGSQRVAPFHVAIEPDASTASYWWVLPLMLKGCIEVKHMPDQSTQGDFALLDMLREMGAVLEKKDANLSIRFSKLKGIDVNMNTCSDVAPTLAVLATVADSPTTIRDIGNMRVKECDRIATLQAAFDKLGLQMESGSDWMRIQPGFKSGKRLNEMPVLLDPQEDHRMAMAFSLLGLTYGNVGIMDAACVEKTYPDFYMDLARICLPEK
ncbi:MAG: 3-phosphoshikimate 1-carboxyvinyltransferase [Acidobacteria bacterium]|nr:MAG: 3-phosphoshikimate 1-carboxyvinyltransferase [Acidobacteriota bacterium]